MLSGVSGSGSIGTTQVTQTRETQGTGQGLGDHQAEVGPPRDRGIGRMILDGLKAIGMGIARGLANIGAKIRDCVTPRVQEAPQLNYEIQEDRGLQTQVKSIVQEFNEMVRNTNICGDFSIDSFRVGCIQCMNGDKGVQTFLMENLDNQAYNSKTFTGIKDHPDDSSKFIAKFGEKQIVLSNRDTVNNEFRGKTLRDKLEKGQYDSLKDLIDQDYGTKFDSMLTYGLTPILHNLMINVSNLPTEAKREILESVQDANLGGHRFGDICDLSFLQD